MMLGNTLVKFTFDKDGNPLSGEGGNNGEVYAILPSANGHRRQPSSRCLAVSGTAKRPMQSSRLQSRVIRPSSFSDRQPNSASSSLRGPLRCSGLCDLGNARHIWKDRQAARRCRSNAGHAVYEGEIDRWTYCLNFDHERAAIMSELARLAETVKRSYDENDVGLYLTTLDTDAVVSMPGIPPARGHSELRVFLRIARSFLPGRNSPSRSWRSSRWARTGLRFRH